MPDGGFNCESNQHGAVHSSLHSTISVLEGIAEYLANGYTYCAAELDAIAHRRGSSCCNTACSAPTAPARSSTRALCCCPTRHAGSMISCGRRTISGVSAQRMTRVWKMRSISFCRSAAKMAAPLQAKHAGQVHFDMEMPASPAAGTRCRALRVLQHFGAGQ